jgi:hypothetical protein
MKNKILSLGIAVVFLVLISSTLISAAFTVSPTTTTFNQDTTSQTFTVTNTNESRLLNVNIQSTITIEGLVFNITGSRTGINASSPRTFTITSIDSNDFSNIEFGNEISGDLLISNANDVAESSTIVINVEHTNFCDYPTLEGLKIRSIDFVNNGILNVTFGDDTKWYPFEEIEAQVEVENSGNYDMSNIDLEWGLYNTNLKQWIIDPTTEDSFDLSSDDNNVITFTFKLDDSIDVNLADLTNGNDYRFYVKATGEIDDSSSDNDGNKTCASKSNDIDLTIEKDLIILDSLKLSKTVSCGSQLQVTVDAWNIGSKDQKNAYVQIINKDLNIDEQIDIAKLNSFEKKKLSFNVDIPETAEEGDYYLEFGVYDSDNTVYEANDVVSSFTPQITVEGSCSVKSSLAISAEVVSGGTQGQETTIKANLKNLGKSATFKLGVSGYESWATFTKIDPTSVLIAANQSEDVLITLTLDKDASVGLNDFFLEVTMPDGTVENQPISVNVLESNGFNIINFFSEGNTFLKWFIVVDVIIIILIIVVAVRILRK